MCHTTDDKDHFRESPAQKSSDGNGDLAAHAPVPADGTRATRELSESPAMRAKRSAFDQPPGHPRRNAKHGLLWRHARTRQP